MMDLHPKVIAKVVSFIAGALTDVDVDKGSNVSFYDLVGLIGIDDLLPTTKALTAFESQYLGPRPLWNFLRDRIDIEVDQAAGYDPEAKTYKLTELEGFKDLRAAGERLLTAFLTEVPSTYVFTLPLPTKFPSLLTDDQHHELGCGVRLTKLSDEFSRTFPFDPVVGQSTLARLLMGTSDWSPWQQAIQVTVTGYVAKTGETLPLLSAVSGVRTLLGLMVSSGAFSTNSSYERKGSVETAYLHRQEPDGTWRMMRSYHLDHSLSVTLERFGFAYIFKGREVEGLAQKAIEGVLPAYEDNPYAGKLRLAAKWFLDGYQSEPLHAFVQTMVCLEILLGENTKGDSIGASLQNRCAYSLGSTHADRERIRKTVAEAYQIRSNIVHTGKDVLNGAESQCLEDLRLLCRRVVQKELELLRNASGERKHATGR